MKKSGEIIGLPIISIADGKEIGKVKDLVVNPAGGKIAALVLNDGQWYLEAKLLAFDAVISVGEYAVMVEDSNAVSPVTACPEVEKLLEAGVKVIGTKVLTNTGGICGQVQEIVLDKDGRIAACEVAVDGGELKQILAPQILTYAKDVTIINAAASANVAVPAAHKAVPAGAAAAVPAAGEASSAEDAGKKPDEKFLKYLLGKKASRNITSDNGVLIVAQGGEITDEVLQKARLAGKFVELTMNIQ